MADRHHREVHVVGVSPDGSAYDGYMLEQLEGPARKGSTWTKWGTCSICLHEFPLSELEEHDGKLVCHKNGCYKDYQELERHIGGKAR